MIKFIPARPLLGISKEDEEEIGGILQDVLFFFQKLT